VEHLDGYGWTLGAVLLGLFWFGIGYNELVARLEHSRQDRGYTSFLVVIGDGVAVVGVAIVIRSLTLVLVMLACLAACGIPMIVGSVRRYMRERAADEAATRERVRASYEP